MSRCGASSAQHAFQSRFFMRGLEKGLPDIQPQPEFDDPARTGVAAICLPRLACSSFALPSCGAR